MYSGQFLECEFNISRNSSEMCFEALYSSLPQTTKVWGSFRDKDPVNFLTWAEIENRYVYLLLLKELDRFLDVPSGSDEVGSMVTPECGWFATMADKISQAGNECFGGYIRYKFKVYCFDGERNKYTDIG